MEEKKPVKFIVTADREVLTEEEDIDFNRVFKWIAKNIVLIIALSFIIAIVVVSQSDIIACNNFYQDLISNLTEKRNIIKGIIPNTLNFSPI